MLGMGVVMFLLGTLMFVCWTRYPSIQRQKIFRFLTYLDTGSMKVVWVTYQIVASSSLNLDIEV